MNQLENFGANEYEKFLQFLNKCGDDPMLYAQEKKIDLLKEYPIALGLILKSHKYKNSLTLAQLENLGRIAKHYNPECGPEKESCGHRCGTIFCTKKILNKISELENPKIN